MTRAEIAGDLLGGGLGVQALDAMPLLGHLTNLTECDDPKERRFHGVELGGFSTFAFFGRVPDPEDFFWFFLLDATAALSEFSRRSAPKNHI